MPHLMVLTRALRGRPDIVGFKRSCSRVTPMDGRSMSEFKVYFMILCPSFALHRSSTCGFVTSTNESGFIYEYLQHSTVVHHGMLMSYSKMAKFRIQPFAHKYYGISKTSRLLQKENISGANRSDELHA